METSTFEPSITWLNLSGDITITWDKKNEAEILSLIEDKMKKGYSFFIIKPRFFGLLGSKQVRATSVSQIKAAGSVVAPDSFPLHDKEVASAVASGHAQLRKAGPSEKTVERRAVSASEVLKNQTVAVRPIVGG